MSVEQKGHIVELQSLRGLAALAVMLGHTLNFYIMPDWFFQAAHILNGRAAVVLFFILSGFVLTRALRNPALDGRSLAQFYLRRTMRIYPAIWLVSLLSLAYLIFLHWRIPVPDASELVRTRFRADRMDLLHIVASFAGALAFLIPQLWSIFVEILASIAMPFIAYMAYRKRRWLAVAFVVLLAVSFTIGPKTYYLTGLYAVDFIIGAWIAVAGPHVRALAERLRPAAPALIGLSGLAILFTQFLPLTYYSPTAHLVEAALAVIMIVLVVYSGAQVRVLQSRGALFLGDISYSLYLWHFLVLCLVGKAMAVATTAYGLDLAPIPKTLLVAVLTTAITIPLSWLSFEWVEKPGIQMGKWLSRHLAARMGPRAAPALDTASNSGR